MRHLVIVCPECGDSIVVSMSAEKFIRGFFYSRCGTQIGYTVDSRAASIAERDRLQKVPVKNG